MNKKCIMKDANRPYRKAEDTCDKQSLGSCGYMCSRHINHKGKHHAHGLNNECIAIWKDN